MNRRWLAALLLLWPWGAELPAQLNLPAPEAAAKAHDPLNRETPQSSVLSFLEACHAQDYNRASKYFDLREVPADQRLKEGPELARQLERILDRDVQFDVATLSRDHDGDRGDGRAPGLEKVDSFNAAGQRMEIELELVTRRSGVEVWLFSSGSLRAIPQIVRLTSDSAIERFLPAPLVNWMWVNTALWRWIALALAGVLVAVASRWLCWLALLPAQPVLRRFAPNVDRRTVEHLVNPLRLILAVIAFRGVIDWVGPSAMVRLYLERCVTLLLFCGVASLGAAVAELIVGRLRVLLEARHQAFSYSVLPVGLRVAKLTIWTLAVTAILSNWGYNTTTILAGLGVGGLAIALAAQKTIENLFGGVSVISDRPVSVGDFCKFGDRSGTVEDIGLRSTRVRTPDRTLVTVPNAQFSSMTLENFSKRDKMLFHVTLNLRRDTTPDQVRTLLGSVTKILNDHPKVETGAVPVRFIGVGAYSLDVEIFAYGSTRSGDEFLGLQQDLLLAILDAVEGAGTTLALPTQATVAYPARKEERDAGGVSDGFGRRD